MECVTEVPRVSWFLSLQTRAPIFLSGGLEYIVYGVGLGSNVWLKACLLNSKDRNEVVGKPFSSAHTGGLETHLLHLGSCVEHSHVGEEELGEAISQERWGIQGGLGKALYRGEVGEKYGYRFI